MKRYHVESVPLETFKSGPKTGKPKPIKLPSNAIPLGVVSGYHLRVYYLVPA